MNQSVYRMHSCMCSSFGAELDPFLREFSFPVRVQHVIPGPSCSYITSLFPNSPSFIFHLNVYGP